MALPAPRLALLVVAVLLVAGCTQPAAPEGATPPVTATPEASPTPARASPDVALPPAPEDVAALSLAPVRAELAVAPGERATIRVTALWRGSADALDANLRARTAAGETLAEAPLRLEPDVETVIFLDARVPTSLSEPVRVRLDARDAQGREIAMSPADVTFRGVHETTPALGANDTLYAYITLRDADTGLVHHTDDPELDGARFASAPDFRMSRNGPTRLSSDVVLPALLSSLVGARAGETRLVHLAADDAFPARVEDVHPRDETLERERDVPLRVETAPRAAFDEAMRASGQSRAEGFGENDTFTIDDPGTGARLPYVIVRINEQVVEYRFAPSVGERFTLVPAWPNATEAIAVATENVRFRTTPPVAPGDVFTYHERWPNATLLATLNETSILLRHSPAIGTEWDEERDEYGFGLRTWRVDALAPDVIVITAPSDHPLAGRALLFDVRVERVVPGTA